MNESVRKTSELDTRADYGNPQVIR